MSRTHDDEWDLASSVGVGQSGGELCLQSFFLRTQFPKLGV